MIRPKGFTLIELLVVVALIGVFATVSLPPMFYALKKSPIRQASSDLAEACQRARMLAIMKGRTAELVISAEDGLLATQLANEAALLDAAPESGEADAVLLPTGEPVPATTPLETRPFTARLPESVAFKELLINRRDMMEYAQARVRFHPNGTCDELFAVLLSESNEERVVRLEISTGRETVEVIR